METKKDFSKWTVEEINSLLNLIGEKKARELLEGKTILDFKEVNKDLFNEEGVRISKNIKAPVYISSIAFDYLQPRVNKTSDFNKCLNRLHKFLGTDAGITAQEFEEETKRLRGSIQEDVYIKNLLTNTHLPVVMPKLKRDDIGAELNDYLNAAKKSYLNYFPDKFFQQAVGDLHGMVSTVEGSRHERLLAKMSEGPVVGIYFPNALHLFSRSAQIEQISGLTPEFVLSGIDVIIAMIMYPEVLGLFFSTPSNLTAIGWNQVQSSFSFNACASGVSFASNVSSGNIFSRTSFGGGLLYIS